MLRRQVGVLTAVPEQQQRSRNLSPSSCLVTVLPRGSPRVWQAPVSGTQSPSQCPHFADSGTPGRPKRTPGPHQSVPDSQIPPAACQTRGQTGCSSFRPSPGQHGLASTGDHGPLKPHANLIESPGQATTTAVKTLLDVRTITRSLEISLCFWKSSDRFSENKLEAQQLVAARGGSWLGLH